MHADLDFTIPFGLDWIIADDHNLFRHDISRLRF
jgi:hypothetical protein